MLPKEIPLLRNSFLKYPENDISTFKTHLSLESQILNNLSKDIL